MRPCAVGGFARYDGHGSRYTDRIGAWQSIEPADDYTAAAILTTALATAPERTPAQPAGRREHSPIPS